MLSQKYEYSTVSPGTREYREYLALRHEVFCEELRRVPSSGRRVAGLPVESDEYDVHSLHVLCRSRETGEAVGCSRLILPGTNGLNVKSRYALSHKTDVCQARVGEIGRLALSHKLRRYRSENAPVVNEALLPEGADASVRGIIKRDGPTVSLGLYREIFRLANAYGITHCYAAMEPALARLLTRLGFPFHEAGPLNTEVHPARQPYFIGAHATRSGLASRNSCLYQFMFGAADGTQVPTAGAWHLALRASTDQPEDVRASS